MNVNHIDPIASLVALVRGFHQITSVVGERIYGIELPRSAAQDRISASIVIKPAGGTSTIGGYRNQETGRFDFICFGATPQEAYALSSLLWRLLKKVRRQLIEVGGYDRMIFSIDAAGGQISARDRDTQWPLTTQAFTVLYSNYQPEGS